MPSRCGNIVSGDDDFEETAIENDADVYANEGVRHFEADDLDWAIDSFTVAIRIDPWYGAVYCFRVGLTTGGVTTRKPLPTLPTPFA